MRALLRARVQALHARLDQAIEASCLGDPPDLRRLLVIHHMALGAVVPALEHAGAGRLFPGWEGRSRLAALAADLAELRADPPPPPAPGVPSFRTEQEVWGALYALEGARLGNQVLLRRFTASDAARRAMRFLAHGPSEDGATAWPRLVARLNALDDRGATFEATVLGATTVFHIYLAAVAARQQRP